MVLKPLTLRDVILSQQATIILLPHDPPFQSLFNIKHIRLSYLLALAEGSFPPSCPPPWPGSMYKQPLKPIGF